MKGIKKMNPGPKFRVWDTKNNEWLGESDPNTLTYYGFHLFGEVMTMQHMPGEMLKHIVIEQSTGLRDKNGNQIYEGDILMDDTGEPIEYWVVEFLNGGFVGESISATESLFELTDLEIVGNIHQDLELLETK